MTLILSNLSASIDSKQILQNINIIIENGSFHVLMGPNGSGKSSLALTLMGHPAYQINSGSLFLDNHDITHLSPDKRAKLGLFLVFQYPPEIPGVTIFSLLKEAYRSLISENETIEQFTKKLYDSMDVLHIEHAFAHRTFDGFSGGEKKKFEMLQVLILQPKVVIFDEIDSGLDVDALQAVCNAIGIIRAQRPLMSIIMITHYLKILQYLQPQHLHIMKNGSIVSSGTSELAERIEQQGYHEK